MSGQFLRIKKLTGKGIVLRAAKHNHREIPVQCNDGDSHIDGGRTQANVTLRGPGSAAKIEALAQSLMDNSGVTSLRKDAVRALEIVFSMPPWQKADQTPFFSDAVRWAEAFFNVPILSAIVHNDESAPHCHVLLLPLIEGRMRGSDLLGNRTRLQAIQSDFHAAVGVRYGFSRPSPRKRLSTSARRHAAHRILTAIRSNPSLLDQSNVAEALVALLTLNPEPLMQSLAMRFVFPPKGKDTFVSIMTKPCKVDKPIGFNRHFS